MNEPSAALRPAASMISATPTTVSSALAVIASRTPVAATMPIEPAEQEAADDNHADDGEDGEYAGPQIHGRLSAAACREQRHERDQRDGRKVLEQQHREGEPCRGAC